MQIVDFWLQLSKFGRRKCDLMEKKNHSKSHRSHLFKIINSISLDIYQNNHCKNIFLIFELLRITFSIRKSTLSYHFFLTVTLSWILLCTAKTHRSIICNVLRNPPKNSHDSCQSLAKYFALLCFWVVTCTAVVKCI